MQTHHLGEKMGLNMLKWQDDQTELGINVIMTKFVFHFSNGSWGLGERI